MFSLLNYSNTVHVILLFQVRRDLFYSLAIPIPCLLVSIGYVVIAYLFIYTDPPEVREIVCTR